MTISAGEFIRRFFVHVLPKGLQRIRHYGLLAHAKRREAIARARELLAEPPSDVPLEPAMAIDEKARRSGRRRVRAAVNGCS